MMPEEYFAQELAKAERAWTGDRSLVALYDALALCMNNSLPLPEWTAKGLIDLIEAAWKGEPFELGEGRNAKAYRDAFERQKKFRRWNAVESYARAGDVLVAAYDKAVNDLKGKPEAGSRDTIIGSHKEVRADMNAGRGFKYYAAGWRG